MITMFDSIRVAEVRKVASTHNEAVAGYVDGHWPDFHAMAAAFPNDHHLSFATRPEDDADGLDIEFGDARPEQFPGWFERQVRRGVWRPVAYFSFANAGNVLGVLDKAKIHPATVRLLYAEWNGERVIRPGFDGHQLTDHVGTANVDESVVLDDFFGHKHQLARARFHIDAEIDLANLQWRPVGSGVQPLGWGD